MWQLYLLFHLHDHLIIPCLAVIFVCFQMPMMCQVQVTNILHLQPYLSFQIYDQLSTFCLPDIFHFLIYGKTF